MKAFFQKVLTTLKSAAKSPWGGLSSNRLSGYMILGVIILSASVFLGIEIAAAVVALIYTHAYSVSANAIVILGMLLAHHLTLNGLKNSAETKQLNNESKGVATPIEPPAPVAPVVEPVEPPAVEPIK